MAANRRVYDSRHLQADCKEPRSAPEPVLRSAIEYGLPFLLLVYGSNALYRLQFMFVYCVSVSVCLFVFLFRLAAYTIQGGSK